jgi:hypothetical protein
MGLNAIDWSKEKIVKTKLIKDKQAKKNIKPGDIFYNIKTKSYIQLEKPVSELVHGQYAEWETTIVGKEKDESAK